ncbi:hypothetical protein ACKAMS_26700 [Rhodococcus sp. 5A-K4]|uniref:hypothetical protein n=1 Tax=Rhodococcus sp. 5A-K4 TaxID=3384442 RepID=UPI00136B6759|nr:hypothetical protein [Rhodococcus erythropolis]
MTNTELQKPISLPEGRRGLLYSPGDEWAWEQQIRDVQEYTFAADGVPVEHHDRQAAFHRAASRITQAFVNQERRKPRAFKDEPGHVHVAEAAVIRMSRQSARWVSGYVSPWVYAAGAVVAAASLAVAAILMAWPERFLNLMLADAPPRDQWIEGGAVADRVASNGAWFVMLLVTLALVFGLFTLAVWSVDGPTMPRRRKINGQLWIIFRTSLAAGMLAVGGMLAVAIAIAVIEMPPV